MKVETIVEIDEQMIRDLLTAAVEGGSTYWAHFTRVARNRQADSEHFLDVEWVELEAEPEEEGDKWPTYVGIAQMEEGIRCLVTATKKEEWARRQMDNLLNENWDIETADVILQLAVFGEVVYG